MKVLICDDIVGRGGEALRLVEKAGLGDVSVDTLVDKELSAELVSFFRKIKNCIDKPETYKESADSRFDGVDVVIIDNNLAELEIDGSRMTAEAIAGYIRAFTSASYIVSLNKNPDIDFDLRYLIGDFSSRADIALRTEHLENRALWTGRPKDAAGRFKPWYWPSLLDAPVRRNKQIEFVNAHLKDSVTGSLELPADVVDFLSPHARGMLTREASRDHNGIVQEPVDAITFLNFFLESGDRSLPVKDDRVKLVNGVANPAIGKIISRAVAADIDRWFRRDVVGPQDAIVDIPHLLLRIPFLLGEKASRIEDWNVTVFANEPPFGLDKDVYVEHLQPARYGHSEWVQAPCFFWPKLKNNEKLSELFASASPEGWPNVVFCEDTSQFEARTIDNGQGPREFTGEFEGAWSQRFVAFLEGTKYVPRSRFAL